MSLYHIHCQVYIYWYRILSWQSCGCFMLFSPGKVLLHCLPACIVFSEKSASFLSWYFHRGNVLWFLMSFNISPFSLDYYSLKSIWFVMSLLVFILLGILWDSWVSGLVSIINFRKFSAIVASNIFSSSSLFLLPLLQFIEKLHILVVFHSSVLLWLGVCCYC